MMDIETGRQRASWRSAGSTMVRSRGTRSDRQNVWRAAQPPPWRSPGIGHDVGVEIGRQQRVERDGDDAGAERAPERHRIVHRIGQQRQEAVLLPPKGLQAPANC